MSPRAGFDRASLAFGIAGVLVALISGAIGPGWQAWLMVVLASVLAARLLFGPRVRTRAFGIGVLVPLVGMTALLLAYPAFENWRHRARFDPVAWRQVDPRGDADWPRRLRMVDDLLRTHDFRGWDRARVVALLGEPDQTHWDREGELVYLLGPERGFFRIDAEYLVIGLDAAGRVIDARLGRS